MNPQLSPMQQALQKQQMVTQPQPDASQVQPSQDPNQMGQADPNQPQQPSILDALKQNTQQGAQDLSSGLEQNRENQQAALSKAMNMLGQKTSGNSAAANMSKVGSALNTNNYSGRCLAWTDDQTGNKDRSPTAFADFQRNAASGNIKTSGTPPKGARVYFAPTADNPAGHIGLSDGSGNFTGATTSEGIKTFSIQDWEKYANQSYIGYAPPGSK